MLPLRNISYSFVSCFEKWILFLYEFELGPSEPEAYRNIKVNFGEESINESSMVSKMKILKVSLEIEEERNPHWTKINWKAKWMQSYTYFQWQF